MTQSTNALWIRKAKLLIGDGSSAIDLSNLDFSFSIKKGDTETPNKSLFTIYNLSPETATQIRKEFTAVSLEAGYENSVYGLIFNGTITKIKSSHDHVNFILEIECADGDEAYNFGFVSKTLGAGSTARDQVNAVMEQYQPKGIKQGFIDDLPQTKLPRGKVIFGLGRKTLRNVSKTADASWSIQDGTLNILGNGNYLPGEAVLLNSSSGLIEWPQITDKGLEVKCLLNPNIKVGGTIKIDGELNDEWVFVKDKEEKDKLTRDKILDANGVYRVLEIEYTGDIAGNDWYCNMVCIGIDQSIPKTSKKKKTSDKGADE